MCHFDCDYVYYQPKFCLFLPFAQLSPNSCFCFVFFLAQDGHNFVFNTCHHIMIEYRVYKNCEPVCMNHVADLNEMFFTSGLQ